jgi:hypothetical protein
MKDLRVLSNEKNNIEFFAHALDISPSQRNQEWKNMVETLGIDHLNTLLEKTQLAPKDYQLVHKLSHWPIFKIDEFFIKKRDYIFLREIKNCYTNNSKNCLNLAKKIHNDYKHDLIFSYDLTLELIPFNPGQIELWNFASRLTKQPLSEFYCHKEKFKDVIIDQIFDHYSKHGNFSLEIHKDCYKSLQPAVQALLTNNDQILRRMAYALLAEKNLLKTSSLNEFHTLNFLQNTNLGTKEIDLSIRALKFFSNNNHKRLSLMSNLEKFDFLPDAIFPKKVQPKNTAKIRILNRYFPEYIVHYAKTCLKYLNNESSQNFNQGNPTPNCHNFFNSKIISTLLPKNYVDSYKDATFFIEKNKTLKI